MIIYNERHTSSIHPANQTRLAPFLMSRLGNRPFIQSGQVNPPPGTCTYTYSNTPIYIQPHRHHTQYPSLLSILSSPYQSSLAPMPPSSDEEDPPYHSHHSGDQLVLPGPPCNPTNLPLFSVQTLCLLAFFSMPGTLIRMGLTALFSIPHGNTICRSVNSPSSLRSRLWSACSTLDFWVHSPWLISLRN